MRRRAAQNATRSQTSSVIQAKLTPPALPEARVLRPRVEGRLATLVQRHGIVVVAASAGAGKTTAIAGAVILLERPVAWLSIDRTDATPGRLVTYLEAALARAVPAVAGVASDAMAAAIPHAEAAGLLVEAVGDEPVLLVIDELERLQDAQASWGVIEAVLRYAPAELKIVLASRRGIPQELCALPVGRVAVLGEADLAFTAGEAAEALARMGREQTDAAAVVEATGGWVTGVLYEAWRAEEHVDGVGGEADPLHGYLSAHILGHLPEPDREFLVTSSLLHEVSAPRAEALGAARAGERLASLRAARLPVAWRSEGRVMRCHPRFREYLLERLERRGEDELRRLRLAHGRLLAAEGHDEEAVNELILAGAPEEAVAPAERAILPLIERLDLELARRWLAELSDVVPAAAWRFTLAELMLAVAESDIRRATLVADGLEQLGLRDAFARASDVGAALMAWSAYLCAGRTDDAHAVLAAAGRGPATDAVRYALQLPGDDAAGRPQPSGGPLDALILATDFFRGRLTLLDQTLATRWIESRIGWLRIAVQRALGRTERALELYETAEHLGVSGIVMTIWTGPDVLMDAGRQEAARDLVRRGRELARSTGSLLFQGHSLMMDAKLALRLEDDPAAARAALDELESVVGVMPVPHHREELDTWYGLALLRQSDVDGALARLRRAVDSMVAGDRVIELATAAVYLAEAEWRAGDEHAADRAADLALDAARHQGSNHLLLQALADFPVVVSRRIDREPNADSAWHELGRALLAQGAVLSVRVRSSVHLEEFGRCAIVVNGEEARPRIAKTYELLAYLATRPDATAERDELLETLFDGRADESARAYLRQAVRWLRHVLPDDEDLVVENGRVRLDGPGLVSSDSTRLEAQLAEAARLHGEDRLAATADALALYDRGGYLPCGRSVWVEDRRRALAEAATEARHGAADLAFAQGRYAEAERLIDKVLAADPAREAAWRLVMRLANSLGDEDRVIRTYHACERALAAVGAAPAASTRELLEHLRR
jgi:DNA-binding SARP family transcriptional activator